MKCNEEKNFIILISPLNTIYTYNFEFVKRSNHIKYFNKIFNENNKNDIYINNDTKIKLEILPYIEENVFQKNIDEKLIQYFYYYAVDESEKNIISKEHEYLCLTKYFVPKFILKQDLISDDYKNKFIIFISENYIEDFIIIKNNKNIIRILNWMLYKKTDDYIEHQKETLKYIEYNNSSKTNNCELIIECLRQCNILIKYCFNNLLLIKNPNLFRDYLISNFLSKSIKCLNILDHGSTAKLYRKRELAQTSELVHYVPFMHHFINLKDENDFDKYYEDVKVILQRNPYFYNSNKDIYKKYFQNIFDIKKEIVQLHPISIIDTLFNRYLVYQLLYNFVNDIQSYTKEMNIKLEVPLSLKYKYNENLNNIENLSELKKIISNNILYPFMIKPVSCEHHEMKLILNEEGLNEIFLNETKNKEFIFKCKEFIIQKYINHGGEMIKTFCINGKSYEFIRPSTPNLDKNSNNKISETGEFSLYNELIYQSKKNNIFRDLNSNTENTKKILEDKFNIVKQITLLFLEKTKITLFGLDYLYDNINDIFYILEINYFPSYRELGNKINSEFDRHVIKFYHEYKEK